MTKTSSSKWPTQFLAPAVGNTEHKCPERVVFDQLGISEESTPRRVRAEAPPSRRNAGPSTRLLKIAAVPVRHAVVRLAPLARLRRGRPPQSGKARNSSFTSA